MTPESRSALWTILIVVVVVIAILVVIGALDRANAFAVVPRAGMLDFDPTGKGWCRNC